MVVRDNESSIRHYYAFFFANLDGYEGMISENISRQFLQALCHFVLGTFSVLEAISAWQSVECLSFSHFGHGIFLQVQDKSNKMLIEEISNEFMEMSRETNPDCLEHLLRGEHLLTTSRATVF